MVIGVSIRDKVVRNRETSAGRQNWPRLVLDLRAPLLTIAEVRDTI